MAPPRATLWAILLGGAVSCSHGHGARGPEGEEEASEAQDKLQDAERLIRALDVDTAQKRLNQVRELLKSHELQQNPDAAVLWDRFNQDQGDLEIARGEKAKHELQLKVNAQEQKLERARGPLLQAIEDLDKPDIDASKLKAVKNAIGNMNDALSDGKPLEAQSKDYAEDAKHEQRTIDRANAAIALGEKRVAFITGPLAQANDGLKLMSQATAEKDLAKRQDLATQAKAKFQGCVETGTSAVQASPEIAKVTMPFSPKPKSSEGVITACKASVKSTDKFLALVAKAAKKKHKH